ncbi:MAG TPA: hypothetical protein VKH62_11500 [Candidatus Binatia bacterium]|nr:hypothetical protein [Candidatus Binatia bacterium]
MPSKVTIGFWPEPPCKVTAEDTEEELPMFTDEPVQYLFTFKKFLLEQQSKKEEPTVAALIAEINRELLKRTVYNNLH